MKRIAAALVVAIIGLEALACGTFVAWVEYGSSPDGAIHDWLAPILPEHLLRWSCGEFHRRFPDDPGPHCYHAVTAPPRDATKEAAWPGYSSPDRQTGSA